MHLLHVHAQLCASCSPRAPSSASAKPATARSARRWLRRHFPQRMRGALLAGFFASASVGSVLGVMLGGVIAAQMGLAGRLRHRRRARPDPGAALSLRARLQDRRARAAAGHATHSARGAARDIVGHVRFADRALGLHRRRRAAHRAVGAVGVAAELPEPRLRHRAGQGRHQGGAGRAVPGQSAALSPASSSIGRPRRRAGKFVAIAVRQPATMVALVVAFGAHGFGIALDRANPVCPDPARRLPLTCTVGPVVGDRDRCHPSRRARDGRSVLSLFQNLFGLAAGPFIAGMLSDAVGLQTALTLTPLRLHRRRVLIHDRRNGYEAERQRAREAEVRSGAMEPRMADLSLSQSPGAGRPSIPTGCSSIRCRRRTA